MKTKKILHLTLFRKWFEQIVEGIKLEEYREIKPYWTARLKDKEYNEIWFKNGYAKNAPFMKVEYKGIKEIIKDDIPTYAIQLGKILEIKNYNK